MEDVLKAGVLEVTVVQAIGVGLYGSSKGLSRGRRKPAVQARVSVDGTTRSGPPAQRSHNPVWFPARPAEGALSCVQHTSSIETKKECSVKSVRDAGQQQHISSRAGDGGGSSSVLDRTRGRNSYGGFEGGSSGGGVTGTGGGDTGSSRQVVSGGTVGRGLLFDVREFYGPCRIQVELVSGGGAGSSSGGLGTSGGGTVLGRCEARLAEALVGKGASTSLPSDGLSKGPAFSPESHDFESSHKPVAAAPFAAIPETPPEDEDSSESDVGTPSSPPAMLLPGGSPAAGPSLATSASDPNSRHSSLASARWSSCLPGGTVFGRWRRRGGAREAVVAHVGRAGGAIDGGGVQIGGANGNSTVVDESSRTTATRQSSKRSWILGRDLGSSSKSLGDSSKSSTIYISIEEAEALATRDWGGGDSSGGTASAKDLWKELMPPAGIGGSKGAGSGGGKGGGLSAVRLRLRFVPLWDCVTDGGAGDGLGALHAAARDGDWKMMRSLVLLWETLCKGAQPLTRKCRDGLTPIQHCIEAGKESALRELLHMRQGRQSAFENMQEGEDTALHTAIKAGEDGILKMLLSTRRRPENHTRIIPTLRLSQGSPSNALINTPGADGLSPLSLAALYGNEFMVKCILDEGADASKVDARGMTALAHAAQGGKLLAVRALLKPKLGTPSGVPGLLRSRLAKMTCAPCKANEDGMGPLALAAAGGWHLVVSELIRADIPYRTRDLLGRTPLHHAAGGGHMSVLRVLVAEMQKGKMGSAAGPGGGIGGNEASSVGVGSVAGGLEGEEESALGKHHTLMMDGGPFKLSSLDLAGRTAHATALLNKQYQAAAFLEVAAAELEPRHPKEGITIKRRSWGGSGIGASGYGSKMGQPPRATNASPLMRNSQGSGSGSGVWSGSGSGAWSGSGSGTPSRRSPISSGGMESSGSVVGSEDLSYEYCESDREE